VYKKDILPCWRADGGWTALLTTLAMLAWADTGLANTTVSATDATQTSTTSHPLLPGSRLVGETNLRFWGLRIYKARLWTSPFTRVDQVTEHPLILELDYHLELKGSAIADKSLSEMLRVGAIPEPKAQQWLTQMQRIFPDIKTGDSLTGQHHPGQGASFFHNGRSIGRIDDPEFASRFFGIWLSPTTSQPEMRINLLGLSPNKDR
jgi:hypothetical protein